MLPNGCKLPTISLIFNMKAEELRIAIRNVLEQGFISTLSKYGYSWNKSKMCFHRKVGDFKQTILINSSVNPRFTDGIGYISIHLFYNSPKIEKMASVLIDAKTDFAKVKNVLNINSGFISGKGAVSFDLSSVDDLSSIFNPDNALFSEILSFLDKKVTIQDLLIDFENNKDYIWWNSKGHSILMIISMYYVIGNKVKAKELAKSYYQNDKCGKFYRNVLRYFEESNNIQTNKQQTD